MREIKCWEKRKEEGARCPFWHDDPGLECPGYPHLCDDIVDVEVEDEEEAGKEAPAEPPYESYVSKSKPCITNGDCESCNLLYGDCDCRK